MKDSHPSSLALSAKTKRLKAAPGSRSDSHHQPSAQRARTIGINAGGTGLKAPVLNARRKMMMHRLRVDTPSPCPSKALVDLVKPLPTFDRVSVGFPSYVHTA